MSTAADPAVWFVTGASSGIGAALADQAVDAGDKVVATFREAGEVTAFSARTGDRTLGVLADVRDDEQVRAAVAAGATAFGAPDVVVNCAGYAVVGAVEELSDAEMAAQLDVNTFGAHRVIRAALPLMRARGRGVVVNVSSVAALQGYPGLGAYDASKAALELLSEALLGEVRPLGVAVLLVEPGNVRTEWAGRSMVTAHDRIAAYDATAGASRTFFAELDGHQEGDPAVVAAAIRSAVADPGRPFRLVVGADAHEWIGQKVGMLTADLARWVPSTASESDGPT